MSEPVKLGKEVHEKPQRYWSGAHTKIKSKHRIRYHLVFIPKYRKRVLEGKVAVRLEQLLRQACEVCPGALLRINRWSLEELAIQPDHVHLLIQVQPKYSVATVMKKLKGGSSHVLRAEFPDLAEFLWGSSFWAVGYFNLSFAASVGVVEGSVVREYIRAQQI